MARPRHRLRQQERAPLAFTLPCVSGRYLGALSINKDKKPWLLKAAFLKNEGTPLQEPERSSRGLCWLEKGLGWLWLVVITSWGHIAA